MSTTFLLILLNIVVLTLLAPIYAITVGWIGGNVQGNPVINLRTFVRSLAAAWRKPGGETKSWIETLNHHGAVALVLLLMILSPFMFMSDASVITDPYLLASMSVLSILVLLGLTKANEPQHNNFAWLRSAVLLFAVLALASVVVLVESSGQVLTIDALIALPWMIPSLLAVLMVAALLLRQSIPGKGYPWTAWTIALQIASLLTAFLVIRPFVEIPQAPVLLPGEEFDTALLVAAGGIIVATVLVGASERIVRTLKISSVNDSLLVAGMFSLLGFILMLVCSV